MPYTKVNEANYLRAENFQRYREIMAYFYQEHRRMNDLLYRLDVYTHMQEQLDEVYLERELDQDLAMLVEWGNLETRQEMSEPKSIEEYKNRHFRYQMTETSVAIEEMLENLALQKDQVRGALDRHSFERLLKSMGSFKEVETLEDRFGAWQDTLTHFNSIKKNTADYIAYLNSEKVEHQMQTAAFLVFKDRFVQYLQDFVVNMQMTSYQLQSQLEEMPAEHLSKVLEGVYDYEEKIPDVIDWEVRKERVKADFYGRWQTMYDWFIDSEQKESEYSMLIRQTNQAINRMTRLIQRFGDRMQQYRSRKKDYLHVAKWFSQVTDLEEAHQLSAYLFGVAHSQHLAVNPLKSANKYDDMWELEPTVYEILPHIINYRRKTKATSFVRRSQDKNQAMLAFLAENRQLKEKILTYVDNDQIDLEKISLIDPQCRQILLKWLSLSFHYENRQLVTELGMEVSVQYYPDTIIQLEADDGILSMPKVVYQIIKVGEEL